MGRKRDWMTGTWSGWMAALAVAPSAITRSVSAARPSASLRSRQGTSMKPISRSAATSASCVRGARKASQPGRPRSATAKSKPPNISADTRGVAPAMARASSRPRGLSISAISRVARSPSAWSATTSSSADSTLGSITKSGSMRLSRSSARSRAPAGVVVPLMRKPSSPRRAGFAATKATTCSRALSLSAGPTASSRSMQAWSASAASALAKRSGREPGTNSRQRRGFTARAPTARSARRSRAVARTRCPWSAPRGAGRPPARRSGPGGR